MKNLMGKTRKPENPYMVLRAGNWEWRVLKSYQGNDGKKFARWFCQVITPMTGRSGDLGDVYVSDILLVARATLTYLDQELAENGYELPWPGHRGAR